MARFSVALISSDIDATQRLSAFYAQREIDLENLELGADLESAIGGNGYDLLLLDMASSETAQKVFESCSSLVGRIVALADKDDTDAKRSALANGATEYLNKPLKEAEMVACLDGILRDFGETQARATKQDQSMSPPSDKVFHIFRAVESTSDGVCVVNSSGTVQYWNPSFRRSLGPSRLLSQEECQIENLFANNEIWRFVWKSLMNAGNWHGEVELNVGNRLASFMCRADAIEGPNGFDGAVVVLSDITQRKRLEDDLVYLANHDPLTGAFNRRYFTELLGEAVEEATDGQARQAYLLYIDLDNFKVVNDAAGHAAGDILLQEVSALMQKSVRRTDVMARFGGDEFTLLLRNLEQATALSFTKRLVKALDEYRFVHKGRSYSASASIGVAAVDGNVTADDLLAQVDSACFTVKSRGRNGYAVFRPNTSDLRRLDAEANWAILIKDALKENRFEVWLQPIRDMKSNINTYYEVLLRMRDRRGNLVMPGAFMPAAEQFGNMHQLDQFVVRNSIELLMNYPQIRLSINLSAKSLNDPNLPGYIERLLSQSGVAPDRASFEITETAMIQNIAHARQLINRIRALGCRFALDDFGAGASSMVYLRDLPVDYLKIDGSFIKGIENDPVNQAIVKSINDIAHILGKETVAEFVSDQGIYDVIEEIGIDYGQGYHICVPAPPSAFFSRQRGIRENQGKGSVGTPDPN